MHAETLEVKDKTRKNIRHFWKSMSKGPWIKIPRPSVLIIGPGIGVRFWGGRRCIVLVCLSFTYIYYMYYRSIFSHYGSRAPLFMYTLLVVGVSPAEFICHLFANNHKYKFTANYHAVHVCILFFRNASGFCYQGIRNVLFEPLFVYAMFGRLRSIQENSLVVYLSCVFRWAQKNTKTTEDGTPTTNNATRTACASFRSWTSILHIKTGIS